MSNRLSAYEKALQLLKIRLQSAGELKEKLARKGYSPTEIKQALQKLEKLGLVDDLRYAKAFILARDRFRPRARKVLELELRKQGIDKETITRAFKSLENQRDEEAILKELIRRQEGKYRGLPKEVARRRLLSFLARRGFRWSQIKKWLKG